VSLPLDLSNGGDAPLRTPSLRAIAREALGLPGWAGAWEEKKGKSSLACWEKQLEKKKKRGKEKKEKNILNIFKNLLARCLNTQNWLHNFGMQRKITQKQTVPFPI